jgi:predicted DsbA family dithiol-disulfide isomerase
VSLRARPCRSTRGRTRYGSLIVSETAPLRVEVFSDVVCPWCFVGTERLERVLAELGLADAQVTYQPFMLDPKTPAQGRNVQEDLRRKYGADPAVLFARVEAAARDSGIQLDLTRQPFMYPTAAAHVLLRHAAGKGTQRALVRAMFRAYFLDGRNIADAAVLVPLAVEHGFDAAEAGRLIGDPTELVAARQQAAEAIRMGIRGAPFFVLNGAVALSGAQPESVFREAIERQLGRA